MTESADTSRDRTFSGSSDRSESDIEPHFEPIVKLPEIQISTNEEGEEALLKLRAKLYRFDISGEDGPEWKERGTGEVKLLHHKENNTVRVVMRRDKTLKVCANHFITPWMELKPSTNSDRAYIYTVAADFADEQIKTECLAIKFGNSDFATLFKEKFNEGINIVKTKCKLYITGSDEETDESVDSDKEEDKDEEETKEVMEKLSSLNVSKDKSDQ